MTLLGYPLHELKAIQVKEFLDGAEAEPLLWEAKGTELDKHEIRRQVCAFANGHDTGYLILGASKPEGEWVLEGMDFKGDPPVWVSGVIDDVLRPVPRIDVASISLGNAGQMAVIEIPPIAVPPCICAGTVFERVSGRTITVKDPARLADLYRRGDLAQVEARKAASAGAQAVIDDRDLPGDDRVPRIALALSATAHPPDISSRLFSEGFEQAMIDAAKDLAPPLANAPPQLQPTYETSFEQSNRRLDCTDHRGRGTPCEWHIRAVWDGTVIIYAAWDTNIVYAEHLMELVKCAWLAAAELLMVLGGHGPAHMRLCIDGGDALHGPNDSMLQLGIGRGPISSFPNQPVLESVERELRRSTGERVYEPDEDGEGDGVDP